MATNLPVTPSVMSILSSDRIATRGLKGHRNRIGAIAPRSPGGAGEKDVPLGTEGHVADASFPRVEDYERLVEPVAETIRAAS